MVHAILHILDWLLWTVMAVSTAYVLLFSFASLLPKRKKSPSASSAPEAHTFLVIFPAYREDAVIIHSAETFLRQQYPQSHYEVVVVSDHMQPATNEQLSALPLMLLTPSFAKSSKARALQHALSWAENSGRQFDRVVILDADNIVSPDFLSCLNVECRRGHAAIQCHRTAKNSNNDIAALDGLSEEINNTIFRKGHNRLGLSSALIGSGMCFDYVWFKSHVSQLDSAVEDRELEALLMKENIYIHYAEDILVMDEKVSSSDNFQRQRLRWMTGQVQTLLLMLPYLPKAIAKGNVNYIDKTVQQALIPRSLLLVFTTVLTVAMLFLSLSHALKWCLLLAALCLSVLIAIPSPLRTTALARKALNMPGLVWQMLKNLLHIDVKSKEFHHTTHGTKPSDHHE